MTTLNFLWHFHQPDYREPSSGIAILPWVRLHAVKGYLDLLAALEASDAARVTVNFSGVLLAQLSAYVEQRQLDSWGELSTREARSLEPDEQRFVMRNFFSANEANLIRPHARYAELQQRCGELLKQNPDEADGAALEMEELTDLLVWFNLAWIGYRGQRRGDVRSLIARGRGFNHEDQLAVLAIQAELAGAVLPGYRALAATGRIELTVTPFNHPILPLLIDLAGEGTLNTGDPLPEFKYPQDAAEQIRLAQARFQAAFGREANGMWPAEGSVSDAALALFAAAGVRWVCTDQSNLPQPGGSHTAHLTPWHWSAEEQGVHVFFRDTRLSDNIGFEYANWQPAVAGRHLVQMARMLAEQSSQHEPVVTIALDGENPWENYPDGGEGFLTALFASIQADQAVVCRLPSEIIAGRDCPSLSHIHAGSWVHGNFDIWSRHADARRAWRLLAQARGLIGETEDEAVRKHLLAAESSDWFWWYGDEFVSAQKGIFDELFRGHLIAACAGAGLAAPAEFAEPITTVINAAPRRIGALINPVLDGRVTSYYEWRGAVSANGELQQGSMARASGNGVQRLLYGFSADALWLRVELAEEWLSELVRLGGTLTLNLSQGETEVSRQYELAPGGQSKAGRIAVADIIELALDFSEIALARGQLTQLWLEVVLANGRQLRLPSSGRINLDLISADFAASLWSL